jgi:predicted ATPase
VVLTGGPGAGKTAVLELIRQSFCKHVKVLPEAAGVVFGGGFPREDDPECKRAVQRAIFHVQRELEHVADRHNPAIVLCDRGTLDGLAYWPGSQVEFCASLGTALQEELARYDAVIHLRTPTSDHGYNRQNPLRTESAAAAAEIDARILHAWQAHPRRFVVESTPEFLDKAARTLEILRGEMPDCCRSHVVPALDEHASRPAAGSSRDASRP